MKKITLILLAVMTVVSITNAQTKYKDLSVGFHLGDKEYSGEFGSEMMKFTGSHLAGGVSLTKYLNRSFDGLFYVSYGMIDAVDTTQSFQTHIFDLNATLKFKFNNGSILPENSKIAPFLFLGFGDALNLGDHFPNENSMDFNFPAGGGIDFRVTDNMSVSLMSAFNYSTSDNLDGLEYPGVKDSYLYNTIGLKFDFPSKDTDGDGITDKADNCPTMAGSEAMIGCPEIKAEDKEVMTSAMKGLLFETGSAKMLPESYPVLDNVYNVLASNSIYKLGIEGHTDNTGSDEINTKLSGERAQAARDYLISKGIDSSRIVAMGYGSAKPVVSNDTPEGRKQNRRVEFKLMF